MRTEFPPSIQDRCQEKGRVGRIPSATANVFTYVQYVICFDIDSYVLLLRRNLNPEMSQRVDRCHHCPGCTRELERLYGRIVQRGAQDILFAVYTTTSTYSVRDLVQFISEQEDLDRRLFARNRVSVPKIDIKLFLFRLIAWEILVPQYVVETKLIVFIAAKINEPAMFLFQSIDAIRFNC